MSTHRVFDRICAAAIAVAVLLSCLLWCSPDIGSRASAQTMEYESRLFDTSYVHSIDLEVADWDAFLAGCEDESYVNCTVVIDGDRMTNVGLRAKGNTSMSSVSAMGSSRYSFKLEFDQYQKGRTWYGLDKLCLNNLIQDNTMIKDYLAYMMMADFGVDAPLCSFVYIRVNGEDWGLYLAVEGVEDSFLARNYGSASGDLYKPDSMSFGGGRGNGQGFDMGDFDFSQFGGPGASSSGDSGDASGDASGDSSDTPSNMPSMPTGMPSMPTGMPSMPSGMPDMSNFTPGNMPEGMSMPDAGSMPSGIMSAMGFGSSDVKLQYSSDDPADYANIFNNAKTTVTEADQARLISSIKKLNEGTDISSVVNTEEVMRYFVVHNFVRNGDSYTGAMIHNYYLYEQDGQLSMIPWDYNLAYGTFMGSDASGEVNADIDNPVTGGGNSDRPMLAWIFSDETYTAQYHQLMDEFIQRWFSDGQLAAVISDLHDMLAPYVEKDPTKFCTTEEFETGIQAITQFVTLRAESISNQLEGNDETVDTTGLNLSDMGTMNNGGGMGGFGGDMPGQGGHSRDRQADAVSGATRTDTVSGATQKQSENASTDADATESPAPAATPAPTEQATATESPAAPANQGGMSFPGGMNGAPQGTPPAGMDFSSFGTPPNMGQQSTQATATATPAPTEASATESPAAPANQGGMSFPGGMSMPQGTPPAGMDFSSFGTPPNMGQQSAGQGGQGFPGGMSGAPGSPSGMGQQSAQATTAPTEQAAETTAQPDAQSSERPAAASPTGGFPGEGMERPAQAANGGDNTITIISLAVLAAGLGFAFLYRRRR